jgi:hypothetical protein
MLNLGIPPTSALGLYRETTNRVSVGTDGGWGREREREIDFKELSGVILCADKSRPAGWKFHQGSMFLSGVQSCQEAEFLLFQGTSHFSLKVFN